MLVSTNMRTKQVDTTSVTARVPTEIVQDLDDIAHCMFSNRTLILQQCLAIGIEELKKQRPELVQLLKEIRHRRKFVANNNEDRKVEKKRAGM